MEITQEQIDAFVREHNLVMPEPRHRGLGNFHVQSGKLRVTDPCYSTDTWCSGELEHVRNGTWYAGVYEAHDELDWNSSLKWGLARAEHRREFIEQAIERLKKLDPSDDGSELRKLGHVEDEQRKLVDSMRNAQGRVCYLYIVHQDYIEEERFAPENILHTIFRRGTAVGIDVGVDSGQAGFFCVDHYPTSGRSDGAFYDACCTQTLNHNAGVVRVNNITFGAVSSSGYGDGGYTCYSVLDASGMVIAAGIMFIDPEVQEEEEEVEDAA